ncbi:MAG: DegV family protein [Eubacteriaceae bacterium]|nr:DegV family protein [Eubacteriaceae bacterium]
MSKVQLITDIGSDLSERNLNGKDICVLGQPLIDNKGNEYNFEEIDLLSMYASMRSGTVYHTSQVTYLQYKEAFIKYARMGRDIVCTTLSSGLTNAIEAARRAKDDMKEEFPDIKIAVIDTLSASKGIGGPVLEAYEMVENGSSFEDIAQFLCYQTAHSDALFSVSDLGNLYRSGRLSKTAYSVASTLNIKPLLAIMPQGSLAVIEKARGTKRARARVADIITENCTEPGQTLYCVHSDFEEGLHDVLDLLDLDQFSSIDIDLLGPIIGAHVGADMIGFVYINAHKVTAPPEHGKAFAAI